MSFLKWLVAGVVAAAVGGAAWVAIGYYANYEVGWIAWGIGLLAGLGVRWGAGDRDYGAAPGLAAVAAAAGVVAISKYAVIALVLHNDVEGQLAQDRPDFESEQFAIMRTADEIIDAEYHATGKEVAWPEGMTWDEAFEEADYPAEIWADAKSRWQSVSAADQQLRRDEWKRDYEAGLAAFIDEMQSDAFAESFTPYDLLWFGLAMFTAFRVGSGVQTSETKSQPQPAEDEAADKPKTA